MRKFFLTLIITISIFTLYTTTANATSIQKGTFLRVLSPVEISSDIADIGDEVYFVNVNDMYLGEGIAIPQNARFYGYIEDIKEPVQGTNALIKIKIEKMVMPDRREYPLKGYICTKNGNYIGGEQTAPMYYNLTPHFTKGWGGQYGRDGGVLQFTPTDIRYFGSITKILAGSELFIVLDEALKIN